MATPERPRPGRAARPRRWRRQPQARPQQILDAARRTFARKGFFGATLDDVAREAGITKGTIYLYYPSKQALFSEMVRCYADEVLGELRADVAAGRAVPARDLVRRVVTQFLKVFRRPEYQAMVRLLVGESARFPKEMEGLFREVIQKRVEELASLFRAAMERGEARAMDPVLVARATQAMAWGFAVVQESLRGGAVTPWPEAVVIDTFSSLIWEGIRS